MVPRVCFILILSFLLACDNPRHYKNYEFGIRVYFDIPDDKIDDFFNLDKGTFSREKYLLHASIKNNQAKKNFPSYKYIIIRFENIESLPCDEFDMKDISNGVINESQTINKNKIYFRLIPIESEEYLKSQFGFERMVSNEIAIEKDVKIENGTLNKIHVTLENTYNYCSN